MEVIREERRWLSGVVYSPEPLLFQHHFTSKDHTIKQRHIWVVFIKMYLENMEAWKYVWRWNGEKEEVSKVPRDRKVATTPAKESGDNALVR